VSTLRRSRAPLRKSSGLLAIAIVLTLLASVFVVTSASMASALAGPGGIGVRLLPNASSSTEDPLTLSYIVERIAPGHRVLRKVEISNTTDATADVLVFPAAASYIENKFSFAPGRMKNSLSIWTTVARSVVRLAPGAETLDPVTINVPKRASSGERYAVVWAEVSSPSLTENGVRLVNRVGVRMYISVGNGGQPAAKFTISSLAAGRSAVGAALVIARVDNVGPAAIDISGTLTLSQGPGELSAGPFPVTLGTMLAPSHSLIERVDLGNQIPRGPWRAELSLSSNGTRRSSVTMITFPAQTVANEKRSPLSALTIGALTALALLLAGCGVMLVSRRRRARFE
jgi:hypothetical protein